MSWFNDNWWVYEGTGIAELKHTGVEELHKEISHKAGWCSQRWMSQKIIVSMMNM